MWNAIWKTRSSTINKKEVQILLKIVDDQKTIPKHRLREKRMHVPVVQLHTYTLATTNCRRNLGSRTERTMSTESLNNIFEGDS